MKADLRLDERFAEVRAEIPAPVEIPAIDYDEITKKFDTQSIERTIETFVSFGYEGLFIIKSTIPIGYTKKLQKKYKVNVAFMPEFLREGTAIADALKPDRIVIGANKTETTLKVQNLFATIYDFNFTPMYVMSTDEAESVKLFANAYLAMRVAFFNELDNFAMANNLQARNIITAVSTDKRIGNTYNNPSFGYGGYCFPKDTKQLRSNYKNVPNNIIKAIVDSNKSRKKYIAKKIIETSGQMVGFYRLLAKTGSINFRESAVLDIIEEVRKHKDVIIYEPLYNNQTYEGILVTNDIDMFKDVTDIIVANRFDPELMNVRNKVITRDVFHDN
jgi:UDPglucose 6-dehydrogenase